MAAAGPRLLLQEGFAWQAQYTELCASLLRGRRSTQTFVLNSNSPSRCSRLGHDCSEANAG